MWKDNGGAAIIPLYFIMTIWFVFFALALCCERSKLIARTNAKFIWEGLVREDAAKTQNERVNVLLILHCIQHFYAGHFCSSTGIFLSLSSHYYFVVIHKLIARLFLFFGGRPDLRLCTLVSEEVEASLSDASSVLLSLTIAALVSALLVRKRLGDGVCRWSLKFHDRCRSSRFG